ncbi:MAG: hypothetical protein EP347_06735 [Alphaproteobacteria bacterium]|nr:MAG: hypothetical protein EP347_06735 [Alphaproteobacteria bacterium]
MSETQGSLSARVSKSAAWLIATRLLSRLLGLASTVVVARILVPEDFGLFALAMSVVAMIEGMSATGFGQALIRQPEVTAQDFDTVWTLNLIRALILCLILLICALVLPNLLDKPDLAPLLFAFALLPVIRGFSNPRMIEFERNLNFSRVFILQMAARIVSVSVTIVVVVVLRSIWALVAGVLSAAVVNVLLSHFLQFHRLHFSFASTRKIFSFTAWLNGMNVINSISHNMDRFIVNGFLGTVSTGLFYMGQNVATLVTRELFSPLERALFPGLVRFSSDPGKLRENVLTSIEIFTAIGLPVGFGFAWVARDFVLLIFGEKWESIVPMIQILAPVLGIQTLTSVAYSALLAIGASSTLFYRSIWIFGARLICLIAGAAYFGFLGIVIGHTFSYFLEFLLNYAALISKIKMPWYLPIWRVRRSLIAVVTMVLLLMGIDSAFSSHFIFLFSPIVSDLVRDIVFGAMIYLLCHFSLWKVERCPIGAEKTVIDVIGKSSLISVLPKKNS